MPLTPPTRLRRPPGAAFTLIELLTVIAIVGILAALVIASVGRIRSAARSAACQSNLRQIGAAVLLFANDHRGQLPGRQLNATQAGLAASQPAFVRLNDWNRLAPHLASYLSHTLPADPNERVIFPMFVCPGVQADYPDIITDPNAAIYVINPRNLIPGNANSRAFGNSSGTRIPSLRLNEIPDPARTYMLSDIDKQSTGAGSWTAEAERPVHGNSRNQVYFDGSVRAIPLNVSL